jgi:hypothetical protein
MPVVVEPPIARLAYGSADALLSRWREGDLLLEGSILILIRRPSCYYYLRESCP